MVFYSFYNNLFYKITKGKNKMKKLYYVYIIGKICNPCYIKLAINEIEACLFFDKLGYEIKSIVEV